MPFARLDDSADIVPGETRSKNRQLTMMRNLPSVPGYVSTATFSLGT